MLNLDLERARLRREALLTLLYAAWPKPLGMGLLFSGLTEDLQCALECIERDLDYLHGKGLVALTPPRDEHQTLMATLLADGVDAVEGMAELGVARRRNLRMLRLRVLQALEWGRPQPLGLRLIGKALAHDTDLDLSDLALRRALCYLSERGMAVTPGLDLAKITPAGVDYLSGDGADCEGIARPAEW